ncbi:MAG: 50S ribosomal protein L18 [Patescibacteria group bacterium]|nr:50S ribosomal protein L18 [Patescibacteria group bacterium]
MNRVIQRDPVARRKYRVRVKVRGSGSKPRISVFRSSKYLYAQVIDDTAGRTVASFSTLHLKRDGKNKGVKPVELSKVMGKELAAILKTLKIESAVLDRGSYAYRGSIATFANALRENGITI